MSFELTAREFSSDCIRHRLHTGERFLHNLKIYAPVTCTTAALVVVISRDRVS
jgi:hypothetical protein